MNLVESYCDRELIDLWEICREICIKTECIPLKEISEIALIQINSELDIRAIRKEGRNE